jgi:hypothetical protein
MLLLEQSLAATVSKVIYSPHVNPQPIISSYEIMKYVGGTEPVLPVPRI